MDKKDKIIIVLILIILAGGLAYAYQQVKESAYQRGVQDATLLINRQILNSLQQNGYVPFVYQIQNQTYKINLVPQVK